MVTLLLVRVVDTHGVTDVFVSQFDVIVKVATIVRQFLSLELHNVGADFIKETSIVRYNK